MSVDKQKPDRNSESLWSLSKPIKKYPASLSLLIFTGVALYFWLFSDLVYITSAVPSILMVILIGTRIWEGKSIILAIDLILILLLVLIHILKFI